jgi:LEA14-like dessication related protein
MLAPAAIFLASCKSGILKNPNNREIQNVRITDIGLLQTTAGLDLVYYNPNDFGVTLSQARGDVYIDNMYFGRFSISDKVQYTNTRSLSFLLN